MNKQPIPFIEFNITKKCNYYCEYCSQGKANKLNKDLKHADDEVIDGFINFIQRLPEKYIIQLIGGEPFMHPKFFEIAERISELGNKITILTNMFFSFEHFKKFIDITNNNLKFIHGALHIDQIKNLDENIENIIKINDYLNDKSKLRIVTVVEEKKIDIIKKISIIFKENNVDYIPIRMIENSILHKYPKEIEDFINSNYNEYNENMKKNKQLKTDKIMCYAGSKLFHVVEDGTILRCWTHQYKRPEFDSFGNVKDPHNINILNNCAECYSDICNCQHPTKYNMYYPKITNKNYIMQNIAWWIPIASLRNKFRDKFKAQKILLPDQTRPDQTRPDQTRPNICREYILFYNNTQYKKLQPTLQSKFAA
ncbi:radical SAM protein [Brachyspira intermedia]|uniref:radical SAM protein n=1 Tax=Brachyspira intermedia TaxID=84377 RepID=UPI00300627F3